MPAGRNGKSPWLHRLEAVKSISLRGVAAELNRRRLDELNQKLADPAALSGRERTQYRRLLELVERRGLLTELPSDLRADADGMKRCLIAVHSLVGNRPAAVIGSEALAEEMCCSARTARRRVQDVREASLVIVETRRRPALRGGQAENGIKIVWSTIRDLAECQGIQVLLWFEDEAPQPRPTTEQDLPRSGEAGAGTMRAPGHSGHPPGHSGHPPGHSGHPPGHSGHPPGHSGHALSRRAGAPSPLSFKSNSPSPPTPSWPQPPGRDQGEGEQIFFDPEWKRAIAKIATCLPDGIGDSVKAVKTARSHGWNLRDVLRLAEEVATKRIGDVFAWKPGNVWYQLMHGLPGSVITVQPCEAYRRARRELEQRGQRAVAEHRAASSLETSFGSGLDALSPEALSDLAERRLSPDALRWFRQNGMGRGVRVLLLRALQQDRAHLEGRR